MAIRNFAAINMANDNGNHIGLIFGVIQSIKIMMDKFKPSMVVFCWEGKNSSKKRKNIFQGYKGSRVVKKSLNKQFQWEYPEQEFESLNAQLYRIKQYLEILPMYELEIENYEADDIIAYISNHLFKESDKIIISSDRDYFQLINDSVSVYRPIKKELITKETLLESYDISPQNWIMMKCLLGDNSDDVPGINGIGIKRAVKLFPFINEDKQYTLEDLYKYSEENISNSKKGISKYYEEILKKENKEILQRNYDLMQLMSHQITPQAVEEIKKVFRYKKPQFSPFKLRLLFMQDGAHGNIHNFLQWQQALAPLTFKEELLSDLE